MLQPFITHTVFAGEVPPPVYSADVSTPPVIKGGHERLKQEQAGRAPSVGCLSPTGTVPQRPLFDSWLRRELFGER